MTNTQRRLEEFDSEIKPMIENEVLYRYDNLELAQDSANTVNKAVIQFLATSIAQTEQEMMKRVVGEIEGMRNKKHVCESREGWGCEYETAIDDILSSLDKESNPKK